MSFFFVQVACGLIAGHCELLAFAGLAHFMAPQIRAQQILVLGQLASSVHKSLVFDEHGEFRNGAEGHEPVLDFIAAPLQQTKIAPVINNNVVSGDVILFKL